MRIVRSGVSMTLTLNEKVNSKKISFATISFFSYLRNRLLMKKGNKERNSARMLKNYPQINNKVFKIKKVLPDLDPHKNLNKCKS
jgi:hypothetical protein